MLSSPPRIRPVKDKLVPAPFDGEKCSGDAQEIFCLKVRILEVENCMVRAQRPVPEDVTENETLNLGCGQDFESYAVGGPGASWRRVGGSVIFY